jgi:hypothetical protein
MTQPEGIAQVIDHAAELQTKLDELAREVLILTLATMLLALAVISLGIRVWRHQ